MRNRKPVDEITELATRTNMKLRVRSGSVDINGRLTDFLYTLMRDHMPAGVVESLVRDTEMCENPKDKTRKMRQYSNGWLASYANYLAKRLTK